MYNHILTKTAKRLANTLNGEAVGFAIFCLLLLAAANIAARAQTADGFNPNVAYTLGSINLPTVQTIVRQPDGKILIGGVFTSVGGQPVNKIARLNPDGTRGTTFSSPFAANGAERIWSIALLPDGKILIGGVFIQDAQQGTFTGIKRLNADGSFDASFNLVTAGAVKTILILSDGTILIGGDSTIFNATTTRKFIAKLFSNGALDLSFDPTQSSNISNTSGGGNAGGVHQIIQQANGKIVIGGWFGFSNPSQTIILHQYGAENRFSQPARRGDR